MLTLIAYIIYLQNSFNKKNVPVDVHEMAEIGP